ncbi:vWA domain-containing protein [Paraliomyxa miuraensis]|uniref:vWA domain-containing protein n=1 Tax=Paraliomyxa miuraensis TaxID=376150 RepID=UPI00225BF1B7|nr:VWA domain-containing protein [Paraliomyxa miuraensis]MCX4241780.1 VWA domain-containing protein [Paraliomyxa miuraensis]
MTVAMGAMTAACGGDASGQGSGDTGIDLPTDGNGTEGMDGTVDETGSTVPDNCGASSFMLDHQPTNVVLVLDKSYSMIDNAWDHDSDPMTATVTRWNSLYHSVEFIVGEFDEGLNFGAVLFPSIDVPDNDWQTACLVETEPDASVEPMGGAAVLDAMPGPDSLEIYGGTPASAGITTALEHLRSLDPELPRAMILITDGAANCLEGTTNNDVFDIYDENLPLLVASAHDDDDIPTFVVGIDIIDGIATYPQDNPYVRLNEVAIAGGFPQPGAEKFHNAQDEDELRAAISQITSQIGCTIPLEMAPELPDLLSIFIDGVEIPFVESCEGSDEGWHYTNPMGPYDEIELCAGSCSGLHSVGTLSVTYNCIPPA